MNANEAAGRLCSVLFTDGISVRLGDVMQALTGIVELARAEGKAEAAREASALVLSEVAIAKAMHSHG